MEVEEKEYSNIFKYLRVEGLEGTEFATNVANGLPWYDLKNYKKEVR